MNEIVKVEVGYKLGDIQNNLDEVAASVRKYCEDFRGVVVTEETVADGKQMLSNIRKEKKLLDDERKRIKKAWNDPYLEFEKKVKEVIALYDEPIGLINAQVQELEEQRRAKKRETINEIWKNTEIPEELEGWFSLSELYNQRWENATYKEKDIEQEIIDYVATLKMSYDTVKSLRHPYEEDGLKVLKESKDLPSALKCMTNLLEQEKRIKELQRQEEERRKQEEERKRLEELKKSEEEKELAKLKELWDTPEWSEAVILPEEPAPIEPMVSTEGTAPAFDSDEFVAQKIYEVTVNVFEDDLVGLMQILDQAQFIYRVKEV